MSRTPALRPQTIIVRGAVLNIYDLRPSMNGSTHPCRHSFAYLILSRKSSGILWQDLLHGITHGDFGLRG